MKTISAVLVCALLCIASPSVTAAQGRIVASSDEWPLSDTAFTNAPGTARFVRNVASYFTGGRPGRFLAYSSSFGLTGARLAAEMRAAGHTWTVSTTVTLDLATLQTYDGVFLIGEAVDQTLLIDYVRAGGNVYVGGGAGVGGSAAEAARWNTFLTTFGLRYASVYNGLGGITPASPTHAILAGVPSLFYDNGNTVSEPAPGTAAADVIQFDGTEGLLAVVDGCAGCTIGGACVADGTADPSNGCQACDPATSRTVYTPVAAGAACEDGLFCTVSDACDGAGVCGGGAARGCDDGLSCTTDACDETVGACVAPVTTGCLIGGACVADAAADPSNACAACDATVSVSAYSPVAAGAVCDDGLFCTVSDACDGSGTCATSPRVCDDGLSCTIDACDEAAGACTAATAADFCVIAGACVAEGTEDPTNRCALCASASSASDYSPRATGALCGDPACDAATLTPAPTCDGAGGCVPGSAEACPGGTACSDAMSCAGGCTDDTQCVEASYCGADMMCHADEPGGTACDRAGACQSGFCADAFCCERACGDTCESCASAEDEGLCLPYAADTDPEDECAGTDACDGTNACVAVVPDAGTDAGVDDAGVDDAGVDDAGDGSVADSGSPDAGGGASGGGCGCSVPAAHGLRSPWLLMLALLGVAYLRRRRG